MAYSHSWSDTTPTDPSAANQIGADIRQLRLDIEERMNSILDPAHNWTSGDPIALPVLVSTSATRVKAHRGTAFDMTSSAQTNVPWDSEDWDNANCHDNVTNPERILVTATGASKLWHVTAEAIARVQTQTGPGITHFITATLWANTGLGTIMLSRDVITLITDASPATKWGMLKLAGAYDAPVAAAYFYMTVQDTACDALDILRLEGADGSGDHSWIEAFSF